jgi:hypothetical protein
MGEPRTATMSRRIYYRTDDDAEAFAQVMLIRLDGAEKVAVYCPPAIADGPWIEGFGKMEPALDLAALLATQNDQAAVLITYDINEWWLDGLTLVGDSDQRELHKELTPI